MTCIAIASCYDKHNYGSMLQAYATQRAIEKLGHEVATLDISRGRRHYYAENLHKALTVRENMPDVWAGAICDVLKGRRLTAPAELRNEASRFDMPLVVEAFSAVYENAACGKGTA